jgi:DNA transformation protein
LGSHDKLPSGAQKCNCRPNGQRIDAFFTWQIKNFAAASGSNKKTEIHGVRDPGLGRMTEAAPCGTGKCHRNRLEAEANGFRLFCLDGARMPSQKSNIDYLLEQISQAGQVSARAMFGEYAIYCRGKVVALFCDDQLVVKPTKDGQVFLEQVTTAPPYPGARPHFLITGEKWDDADWLSQLVRITADALPMPKPKKWKKE